MRLRNFILFGLALLGAGGIYIFMSQDLHKAQSTNPRVTIGVSAFQDTILPLYAKQKGFFEEEGLDANVVLLGWTEVLEALSSKASTRIDIGINNECSVIGAWNNNKDLRYFYPVNPFDNGFALMARKGGPIRPLSSFSNEELPSSSAKDAFAAQLKGRTIITTSGTDMEQGVAAIARRANLRLGTDVKIIDLPPDEGLIAFLGGNGDAYIGGIPQRFKAAQSGAIELITGTDIGPAPINGFVTTNSYATANPEVMEKVVRVWFRTVKYVNDNFDSAAPEIIELVNKNSAGKLTVDDFRKTWNGLETFEPSVQSVERNIISPSGRNYWKARWDDCNTYFFDLKCAIRAGVSPAQGALVDQVHNRLKSD